MTKRLQVYKCEICGNIVEMLHGGAGTLVCCDEPMKLLEEQTADATTEKHVPVIERIDGGFKVKVGSVPHPMEDKHYIEWIELLVGDRSYVEFLKPGSPAEVTFPIVTEDDISAREYCSIHGLWKG